MKLSKKEREIRFFKGIVIVVIVSSILSVVFGDKCGLVPREEYKDSISQFMHIVSLVNVVDIVGLLIFIATTIWYYRQPDITTEKGMRCVKCYSVILVGMFLIAMVEVAVDLGYFLFFNFSFYLFNDLSVSLIWLYFIIFIFFTERKFWANARKAMENAGRPG